jgi:phosphatidylglycerophosphate synthase
MVTREELKSEYVLGKQENEKLSQFFYYLIYRPLSFYITPLILYLGIKPNAVTFLTLSIVLLMPVSLIYENSSYLIIAFLGVFYCVLDCVDGTMARHMGLSSRLGMYLDSTFGKFYQIMLIFIILALEHQVTGIFNQIHVILCVASALMFFWASDARCYYKLNLKKNSLSVMSGKGLAYSIFVSSIDLLPFAIIFGHFVGFMLISYLVFGYYLSAFIGTQISIITGCVKDNQQ